jgi:RNA polymerase sigma factor (sigma-70 family)
VQTAFAKTALGWSRVRRRDNPEGYVRRAIVNTHLNAMRRKPWREQPREYLPEDAEVRRPERELDDRDAMWHALAELPPRQRAVLVLRYYEDLSEADIAEVLGCSRGTPSQPRHWTVTCGSRHPMAYSSSHQIRHRGPSRSS